MASVSLKNVFKKYPNGFEAVKDFNLEVADKEFIIFAGPSGCGKSTALRMIAGLEDISSGELYMDGKLVNDAEPKDRGIAMLFQNYELYPDMTVYENMAFGLRLRRVPKDEIDCQVKEAAKILDLIHVLDCKPKALSGSQRQRVAMGRAIVRNPKVFLMDEPLSNLDEKLRGQMRIELSSLHQKLGATIIYVTDDQTEAMALGTRIIVMKDGVVQQADSPQNLYDHPVNKFVAGFIGAPQMNLIDSRAEKTDAGVTLTFHGATITLPEERGKLLEEQGCIGREVTLGIRPEDLHEEEEAVKAAGGNVIEVNIHGYKMLGAEAFLYFDINETGCTARVSPNTTARTGDVVKFAMDMTKIHLFDKETEKVIR